MHVLLNVTMYDVQCIPYYVHQLVYQPCTACSFAAVLSVLKVYCHYILFCIVLEYCIAMYCIDLCLISHCVIITVLTSAVVLCSSLLYIVPHTSDLFN